MVFFCELHKYRRSTRTHTYPYEHTYANPTPMSTSKRLCRHISKLTKSAQSPRWYCWGALFPTEAPSPKAPSHAAEVPKSREPTPTPADPEV